jgi:tetratricopeptide (TPR) repeat protein
MLGIDHSRLAPVLLPDLSTDTPLPAPIVGRLSRIAQRHPRLAEHRLLACETQARNTGQWAAAADLIYLRFYLAEHRGRALELRDALGSLLPQLSAPSERAQVARLAEAQGRIAYQTGNYLEATEHWSRALDLAEAAAERRVGVAARVGLGQIHYAMGAWNTGLRFHRDALQHLKPLNDSYLAAKVALNLGVGLLESAQLEDAERQFSHGLAAARRGGHREFEAEAHWHLARAALARGQLPLAIADCRLALDIAARLNHHWLEGAASRTWTDIALARGDDAAAIRSSRHALQLAERIGSRPQQLQAHLQLARLLEAQGQHQQALRHLWQHLALRSDSEYQTQSYASQRLVPMEPPGAHLQAGNKLGSTTSPSAR